MCVCRAAPASAEALRELRWCIYSCTHPSLLSAFLFLSAAYQWLRIAPGLCLIAPPRPFFSALNEACPAPRRSTVCTARTLFSDDFPPERAVLFELICLKSSGVIRSAPSGVRRGGWVCSLCASVVRPRGQGSLRLLLFLCNCFD